MEKATKKRKKSKRLRRRIGLIAIGGMSLMLTVCLSVGATLAWFAGSTWASDDMYMGGPVYVEMAGRGHTSGTTTGDGTATASWQGGNGTLDIMASSRKTGSANKDGTTGIVDNNILLPGQKLLIYSQARVFSTAYTSSVGTTTTPNQSSGANTTNSSSENGMATYNTGKGRVVTTTTSVLRARFTINVEFDPYMGFNNFTDVDYAAHYPVQSADYDGEYGPKIETTIPEGQPNAGNKTVDYALATASPLAWEAAAGASGLGVDGGRRDAVTNADVTGGATGQKTWLNAEPTSFTEAQLGWIKAGTSKAVYEWKYVSLAEYEKAKESLGDVTGDGFVRMGKPFDGTVNSVGGASNRLGADDDFEVNASGTGNGYYGVWVVKGGAYQESASFYKARTTAYMNSYKEHYKDDYNRQLVLTVTQSLSSLEDALNTAFEKLVNESSDNIMDGNTDGFTVDEGTGQITHNPGALQAHNASWLYVDPSIGNDTNAGDASTQKGGWWYLVTNGESSAKVSTGNATFVTETDAVTKGGAAVTSADYKTLSATDTNIAHAKNNATVARTGATNDNILDAKLYEITPDINAEVLKSGDGGVTKIVSDAFPFVNGDFELPGRELTNIFANAKITFQISFQALQAFFPFTPSIDGIPSGTAITGTGKALSIRNAIPIYNEAFDYLTVL
ncbi:MAG: hypothetical protein E7356_05240 [Clostridiales bacterium]|nr:hypothetical protein [Clostridiales bacterium]